MLSSEVFRTERQYWLNKLAGDFGMSGLPADGFVNGNDLQETASISKDLSNEIVNRVMQIGNRSELAIYIIVLTAVKSLLSIYNKQEDVVVGMPVSETADPAQERLNGFLPLRSRIKADASFKDLLIQVKETVLEAEEHKQFPMDGVAELLGIQTKEGQFPQCRFLVGFDGIHEHSTAGQCGAEVVVFFQRSDNRITVNVEYMTALFREETVSGFMENVFLLLEKLMQSPESKLGEMELLSERERGTLLYGFNDNAAEFPTDKTIH